MSGNDKGRWDTWIAGPTAALSVDLLVYPLDTLKTRFQSTDYTRLYINASTGKPNAAFFRGVYQGVVSATMPTLPSSGAFFTTYEQTKSFLTHINTTPSHPNGLVPVPLIHATASSLGELVSCAILTPSEVIKQNAQMVTSSSSPASLQVLRKFRKNPLALWRGYTALAGRNLPFSAMYFPLFERLKKEVKDRRRADGNLTGSVWESFAITFVSGGSASAVASIVTTPVDVIKTRIMLSAVDEGASSAAPVAKQRGAAEGLVDALGKSVQSSKMSAKSLLENPLKKVKKKSKSSWAIGREIVAEKGFKGLWRGVALRAAFGFLGSGLYLGVYDAMSTYLVRRRARLADEEDLL